MKCLWKSSCLYKNLADLCFKRPVSRCLLFFKMNPSQFHRQQDSLIKKSSCPSLNEIWEITHYLLYLHISHPLRGKNSFETLSKIHVFITHWQQLPRNRNKARWDDGIIFLWKVRGLEATVLLLKDSRGSFNLYLNFQETSLITW